MGWLGLVLPLLGQLPEAENGTLDARTWDFSDRPLPLNGTWRWYDYELLTPRDTEQSEGQKVKFPSVWNDVRPYGGGDGFATYTLTIQLPPQPKEYALDMPMSYCSYRLFVNGQLLASNGQPGQTKEATVPQWRPQVVSFTAGNDAKLVLQVSNFYHFKGGVKDIVYLGEKTMLARKVTIARTAVIVQLVLMMLLTAASLWVFFSRQRKRVALWFSLLVFTWGVRSAFSNRYLAIHFFPDFDWTWAIRIEYLTIYFMVIVAILYISKLFKEEVNPFLGVGLIVLNLTFVLFTLLASPLDFTRWLSVYLAVAAMMLLYTGIVVIRALINDRIGSGFLSVSMLLGILLFAYDIITYEGLFAYHDLIFSVGYTVLFILVGFGLLVHLRMMKSKARPTGKLTYSDLYRDDD
jgi:hypothetical protein